MDVQVLLFFGYDVMKKNLFPRNETFITKMNEQNNLWEIISSFEMILTRKQSWTEHRLEVDEYDSESNDKNCFWQAKWKTK